MSDTMDGPDSGQAIIEKEFAPAAETMTSLERGQMDVQISTAKSFPRQIKKFLDSAMSMATVTEDVAEGCLYALPRDGKTIEGPSVRLAEIIASAWGNLHAATRIIGDDGRFIIAQAVVWDLERNVRLGFEVRRRITNKHNKRYSDDMIGVTANAAMSIAFRNAVFKVVPSAFTQTIYRECRKVAVGDAATLADRRKKALEYCQKIGVKPERVLAALGVASELDIDLEKLALLKGMCTAIRDGDTSIDEAFPDPTGAQDAAAKKNAAPTPPATAPTPESGTAPAEPPKTGDTVNDALAEIRARKGVTVAGPSGTPQNGPAASTAPTSPQTAPTAPAGGGTAPRGGNAPRGGKPASTTGGAGNLPGLAGPEDSPF